MNTKNVLLTGSKKGIGLAIYSELKHRGYRVFGCGRSKSDDSDYLSIDLGDPKNAKTLYDCAKEAMGSVDILINNAGIYMYSPIENTKPQELLNLINLNFVTPQLLCSYAVSDMKKNLWGRIINIGSISGSVGEAYASAYSAAKAGLLGLTKSLALELAPYNITANQINPGWVDTNLAQDALNDEEKKETIDIIPQKRFIEPYEIAKLCSYLISDDAKGLTGQGINLCAGLSCGA